MYKKVYLVNINPKQMPGKKESRFTTLETALLIAMIIGAVLIPALLGASIQTLSK